MTAAIAMTTSSAMPTPAGPSTSASDDDSSFSFHDLISIVNPLQHIPVVSTLYRAITGDTIKPLERIAGDTLYGGAWGFVSSVANLAFKDLTGKDFGDTALALVEGDNSTDVASIRWPHHRTTKAHPSRRPKCWRLFPMSGLLLHPP